MTRLMLSLLRAAFAATAQLLKKQNPIAHSSSAWCPGGLTKAKAFLTLELTTCMVASTAHPAAIFAALAVPSE
eukprot:CAMPEP_0182616512 /NCGR_PEP_ID=MMETSP1330-20130603/38589_1 /TAXON_ID=464278 /ORGANISM="Picochlorum sp., Strain RCC944" /LENGTH=72 /DNA_ID=CAMNT_0024836563 /DNA_START=131 /DNA_END=352 /DNA_ORIENTATION=+